MTPFEIDSILLANFRFFFNRIKTDSRSFGSIGSMAIHLITIAITLRIVKNDLALELRITEKITCRDDLLRRVD